MTVWASSVVIDDNGAASNADAGTFTTVATNGRPPIAPQVHLGDYPISTLGGASGGTIAGQGGGISIA